MIFKVALKIVFVLNTKETINKVFAMWKDGI